MLFELDSTSNTSSDNSLENPDMVGTVRSENDSPLSLGADSILSSTSSIAWPSCLGLDSRSPTPAAVFGTSMMPTSSNLIHMMDGDVPITPKPGIYRQSDENYHAIHEHDSRMIPLGDMPIEPWNQPHYSSITSEDQSYAQGDIYSFATNAAIHHNQMIVEEDTTTVSLNVFSDGEGCALTPTNLNRRRREKTKRGVHNTYGRKGTLRCYECQRRNSKCVYSSVWLPCEFCVFRGKSSPCVKLPGPKATAALIEQFLKSPPKPVATAFDAVISGEDALLLRYAYSGESKYTDMVAFSTSLAATQEYGYSINDFTLRQAVLAMAASDLDPAHFEEREIQHKAEAWRALSRKIDNPVTICEADVFASCILAMLAWETGCDEELACHVNGCLAFLQYLDQTPRIPSKSFQVFKPYVTHWMDYLSTLPCVSRWPVAGFRQSIRRDRDRVTFRQRVEFFDRFVDIGIPKRAWHSGVMEALHDILTDSVQSLTFCIYGIAVKEMVNDFRRDQWIAEALDHVNLELNDPDLRATLHEIRNSIERLSTVTHTLKEQLEIYQLNQEEGIELARIILRSTTILIGLGSPEANRYAKTLLSSYQTMAFQADSTMREYYCLSYPGNILLAAMALSPEESKLSAWVIQELGSLPSPVSSVPLKRFWETRTTEAVVDVLKQYVRIPKDDGI